VKTEVPVSPWIAHSVTVEEPRRSFWSTHSDESLARRAACGDDCAFDELRHRYERGLSRYAARLVGDAGLGQEIARRALRDARRALRDGRQPSCMSPWLYRLVLNIALRLPSSSSKDEAIPPRLPERQRQAFVLREVYGLSVSEIAAELGLSTREVEEAQFAARRSLAGAAVSVRAKPPTEPAQPPAAREPAARRAVLAVAAAAVALCVGMPVAASYVQDGGTERSPGLATASLADRAL
jgi:DNA-directed RNA polymerase specialized sigma24 family protein